MTISNAGGSSNISEALSMQYMHWRYGATDFIPEMEAVYWIEYKIADYIITNLNGENVGVSVTRAVSYPFDADYSLERARDLVGKKLYGLIVARECITEEQSFHKSILHVWCISMEAATNIQTAFEEIKDNETYEDVVLICTVCNELYLYTNRLP